MKGSHGLSFSFCLTGGFFRRYSWLGQVHKGESLWINLVFFNMPNSLPTNSVKALRQPTTHSKAVISDDLKKLPSNFHICFAGAANVFHCTSLLLQCTIVHSSQTRPVVTYNDIRVFSSSRMWHQVLVHLLSPPSERSEWRRYCFRSMCVCVCVSVRNGAFNQTVKATDFKFDVHVSRDSPDMNLKIFLRKDGVCKNSLGGDTHSHTRLLVLSGAATAITTNIITTFGLCLTGPLFQN